MSLIPGDAVAVNIWDKLAHFLVYGLFSLLGYVAAPERREYLGVCLGIITYSALLELGQSFVPGRMMSVNDLVANILGVMAGAVGAQLLQALWARRP